jgi:magnesium transporter
MVRRRKKGSETAGLPPGTLVHVGEQKMERARITLIDYDQQGYRERELQTVEESFPYKDTPTVTWINVDGIHQVDVVEKLGAYFDLHPLLLEDILNTEQRPKMEDYGDCIFIVLKMLWCCEEGDGIQIEQVSLVLGPGFVISFQEREGDVFEPIRQRIRNGKGRIRKAGADYLAYALVDATVDGYFSVLERLGDVIEDTEDRLAENPARETLRSIRSLKNTMISLRRSIWPLREVIGGLERIESRLVTPATHAYLRDLYDHTIQIIDTIESYRDITAGMIDIYLSSISNRLNEVMKVLTMFASIFIPLTFIAGIYGMNFRYMPELDWRWGYFAALAFMGIVGTAMLVYFKRKRWR